jgi:riboflavin-specific deaminase-like protein
MRRLIPDPAADTSVAELVSELRPWENAPEDRPFVYVNFALTLDGRSTIDGVSGKIGSARDTELLVGLRTRADAVMIGGGTMRAERYSRAIRDPEKREAREREGLAPDPQVVIVSGRLDLPWDAPLFEEAAGKVLIFTTSDDEPPETAAEVEVIRHEGKVDIQMALAHLREAEGVRSLLCEGGAGLHGELLGASCVDEIFVSHAPKLVGGRGPGLVEGLYPQIRPLEVAWLILVPETGELFARYRVAPPKR